MIKMLGFFLSNNMPTKLVSLQKVYMYVSRLGNTNVTYIQQREFIKCLQSAPIKEGKFDFIDTITSLSEKLSSSVIGLASENNNHNLSSTEKKICQILQ